MIRAIDMQTALHALPEQARAIAAEQASLAYRQVSDLGKSLQENLRRHERINQTRDRGAASFQMVEGRPDTYIRSPGEKSGGGGRRERDQEKELYAPQGRTLFPAARYRENTGTFLSMTA